MQIFVKTPTGKKVVIPCSPANTVGDFKVKLQKVEDIPPDQQRIIYRGEQLDDEKLLKDYHIEDESTVHVILRLRGGGCPFNVGFEFASMKSGAKRGFSKNGGPPYRTIGRGFNLEGRCMNKKCECFDKRVWSNLGFSRAPEQITSPFETAGFNIGTLIHKTPCPMCKESLNPNSIVSCGFFQCQYSYEGYQEGNNSAIKGSGKSSDSDGFEYHNGMMDSKTWTTLILVVKPL